MQFHTFCKRQIGIVLLCSLIILASTTSCRSGIRNRIKERRQNRIGGAAVETTSSCDNLIPGISGGYGSEGPYDMGVKTVSNPLWKGKQVAVFFPKGASGQRPVMFFSHGFGATDWKHYYTQLIRHMVSRGNIVIYSPYKTIGASFDERYAILWNGFELAVDGYGDKMDLTRVGFVGHSFGGGATPAMAYKGLVGKGWGKNGAFMYIMAPWYVFQITPEQLRQFPKSTVMVMQIFDKDEVNDHRMAIDIYRNLSLPKDNKHFLVVRSEKINGCDIVADHATPNRNPSLRIKQYGIFFPLDAFYDLSINGNSHGNDVISVSRLTSEKAGYQPIGKETDPAPKVAEKNYKYPWNKKINPRLSFGNW